MKKLLLVIIIFSLIISIYPIWLHGQAFAIGYELWSDSYRVWESSVNVGGWGVSQTSTSYKLRESIGEIATGISTSSAYKLHAGWLPMQEVYIAVSLSTTSVSMSPDIGGITGGTSSASVIATTTTDSPSGYAVYVSASTSPAMKCQSGGCSPSTDNFTDYTPSTTGTPDYSWSIPATSSEFGFTPYGDDTVTKYQHSDTSCNQAGTTDANTCWYNFSTSNETITQSYSANHPNGTATTIKFQAGSGSQNNQTGGDYGAVITITVVAN